MKSELQSKMTLNATSKMYDVVVSYPSVISVLERFEIPLGFGDQSIKEIAEHYNIHLPAFLAIIQVFEYTISKETVLEKESIPDMLRFLKSSHIHFKEKQIPELRVLLNNLSDDIQEKYAKLIVSFFDGYMEEVGEHFLFEDETVFPYINSILHHSSANDFEIKEFEKNHTDIEQKLLDLKSILIKYIPEHVTSPYRIMILRKLIQLEDDLKCHGFIEDLLLVPTIKQAEKNIQKKRKNNQD